MLHNSLSCHRQRQRRAFEFMGARHLYFPLLVVFMWLISSPFWIQKESLWIDEAGSAVKCLAHGPQGVWEELLSEKNSNLHLPAYHYYLWGFSHVFGHSEFALRLSNIPWILVGFICMIAGFRHNENHGYLSWLALFLVTSPFLFYYANEVRPYAMQFSLSCVAFVGIVRAREEPQPKRWPWAMAGATVLLAWTTIYGLAWWLINFLLWMTSSRGGFKNHTKYWVASLLFLGGASALIFHLWVLSVGAKASAVGETGFKSLGFALCEWTGAAGFLPGRSQLRSGMIPSPTSFALAGFTAFLTLLLLFRGALARSCECPSKMISALWTFPSLGILASGLLGKFRLVGRHFTPVAPSFFLFLSLGPKSITKWNWPSFAALSLLGLWGFSDYRLATDSSHRKDDYRGAVHWLLTHSNHRETVWWAADMAAARYYGLENYTAVMNSSGDTLARFPRPSLVAFSKPDIYDPHNAIQQWLKTNSFKQVAFFQSFEIWAAP